MSWRRGGVLAQTKTFFSHFSEFNFDVFEVRTESDDFLQSS